MLYLFKRTFNHFTIIACVMYVYMHTHILWYMFRSQKTTLGDWFFPLTFVWVLRLECSSWAASEAPLPPEPCHWSLFFLTLYPFPLHFQFKIHSFTNSQPCPCPFLEEYDSGPTEIFATDPGSNV